MNQPRRRHPVIALCAAVFLTIPLAGCSEGGRCDGDVLGAAVAVGVVALGFFAHDYGSINGYECPDRCPRVYSDSFGTTGYRCYGH